MAKVYCTKVEELRYQLQCDAQRAKMEDVPEHTQQWLDPHKWSQYVGPDGKMLYLSFSDEELLDIIRSEALVLGRIPAQREVFCVYRDYIRRRFGNWIKALRAAGLREPKQKHE